MVATKGHFIVVEGLEGSGKSTAIATIKAFLKDYVGDLIVTREPGGTALGEEVRHWIKDTKTQLDARAELLLLYAARVQLLEQVIKPALQNGNWVVADRFELSTFAYQGGGRKLDAGMIQQISHFCLQGFQPNLTIFLDVLPAKGLQRIKNRGKTDRIEQESLEFFNSVYTRYQQEIARREHIIRIDAMQPLSVVQQEICTTLKQYLAQHATALSN